MNNKKQAAAYLGMLLSAGWFLNTYAADAPTDAPFNVETFHGVKILHGLTSNAYPRDEVADGREGWVVLNMMIDPRGKPYEVMVVDSSGNPAFEKAALKAVNWLDFQPARRGKYQPDLVYSIGSKADRCGIEVVGDEGTTFDLVQ